MDAFQQAIAHHQVGRLREAEAIYRQILAQQPDHAQALNMLGVLSAQTNRLRDALELIQRSIALVPTAEAYNNLGNVLRFMGRLDESLRAYETSLQLSPNDAKAHTNLGTVLNQLGRHEQAIAAVRAALKIEPTLVAAHSMLGNSLQELGRFEEARSAYESAIVIDPSFAEGHSNLGNVLANLGQLDDAVAAHQRAIRIKPQYASAYVNLSGVQRDLGRLDEAVAAATQALTLRPDLSEGHMVLANALMHQGRTEEAVAAYRRALQLKPNLHFAHSNMLLALHNRPFDPAELFVEHRRWNASHAAGFSAEITSHTNSRDPNRRLKIAYVSPDLRSHPIGRFMLPVLEHHDRSQFHVSCFAGARPDDLTRRLQSHVDAWHDTLPLSDAELAARVRAEEIDILIDHSGHTANGRLLVFARKPAPVQVTWLGYPDTTGMDAIDYRITDAITDPPGESDARHSEKLVRLEGCFICYQPPTDRPALARPADRRAAFTFGCFNNFTKVSPQILRLWGRILEASPAARLLIKSRGLGDPAMAGRAMEMMRANGVAADRVDLLGHEKTTVSHLERYNHIDVALDTWPYNGTTTTCDALGMGVTVVTLKGNAHVARTGASLLTAAGLPDWIAADEESYVRIAVDAATMGMRSVEQREALQRQLSASQLCDAPSFVRRLEAAYRTMWRTWCAN
jgi:predicted O-linked N-acetylglucosamine transferase (SPINDLY family)